MVVDVGHQHHLLAPRLSCERAPDDLAVSGEHPDPLELHQIALARGSNADLGRERKGSHRDSWRQCTYQGSTIDRRAIDRARGLHRTSAKMERCVLGRLLDGRLRTVLVVAHPDDETIGAGGHLPRFQPEAIVHLTDGAPLSMERREEHAVVRAAELREAMSTAHVPPER